MAPLPLVVVFFWNQLLAGSMLAAIVPILLLLPFQQYYVRGVTGTGLKE